MDSFIPQLTEALRGIWHARWVGLAVAWLAGLGAATYIFLTPDKYEASARVYVDTQSILKPLMSGLTVQPDVEQQLAILSRTLISRPNVEKLVRMTDMDLHVRSSEQREKLVDSLMRTLYIQSLGRDNLYTISYRDTDSSRARRVVQSLLSIFVDSGLSEKGNDTGRAKRFIDDQIKSYAQRLTEAENRVKEFKLKHMDFGAGEDDYFASMSKLSEEVRKAKLQLQEANQSREALKLQVAQEQANPSADSADDSASSIATPELDTRIDALKKNLDDLLLRYTDQHPDVVNVRKMIAQLEEQRKEERKRLRKEQEKRQQAGTGGDTSDPVFQQLKLALADSNAQIAGLRARVADYESRFARLRAKAQSVPEMEAEFARLNRDYAIEKQNYQNLVQRRESALMSGELEQATGVASFRVIDPPRTSPNPVSPNRQLLVPLALLLSLCAGVAASYLFSVARPTFHDNRILKTVGKRPVLGAVSLLRNAQVLAKRRRQAILFFGGLGGLAASYSAAIAIVFIGSFSLF